MKALVPVVALAMALTGCGILDDEIAARNNQLSAENAQLSAENAQLDVLVKRLRNAVLLLNARLDETVQLYNKEVREAQIAAACDYGPDLCPAALAAPGRALIATGDYYGAAGTLFWTLVGAKFIVFAVSILIVVVFVPLFRLKLIAPQREAVEAARLEIESVRDRAAKARIATQSAQREREYVEEEIAEAREKLSDLLDEVRELEEQAATLKAARDAISGL